MGLKDHELKWVVNHLGHSVKVHLQHYRARSGLIERLDIAKLMLLQEKNIVGRFAGVELKDITFDDLEDEDSTCNPVKTFSEDAEDADSFEEDMPVEESPPQKSRKKVTRVSWTRKEIEEIEDYFKDFLDLKTKKSCSGQKYCLSAIARSRSCNGSLCRRHWETVKKGVPYDSENKE